MILTFFTSNTTKLAHVRYIAKNYPVRILGFRQRTYHANYEEPRIQSRSELLKESYDSALTQCHKSGIDPKRQIFFLEDTSVRIEALSTKDCDNPGLDIKYWMQSQTFSQLDQALRKAGNNRRVEVRSDVLLHVPDSLKSEWEIEDDYLVFVGKQKGQVVNEELTFDSNLVFPWLDNQSFNKWFQPIGADKPLGALNITLADRFDFRRNSFKQLLEFLESKCKLQKNTSKQTSIALDDKPNPILCGYPCAGKTTASQYLARKFGYLHIEASDFMHLGFYQRHGFKSPISIDDFAEQALLQEPLISVEKIAEHIKGDLTTALVISGLRSMEESIWLQNELSYFGKILQVVFIETEQEERFRRLVRRKRSSDKFDIEDFQIKDKQQERMGLAAIQTAEETQLWANDRSLEAFFEMIDLYIKNNSGYDNDPLANFSDIESNFVNESLQHQAQINPEDAILVALLKVWSPEETRPYYTTTEIAKMINELFTGIQPKHKDNVSRYFNQDFRPYYEIYIDKQNKTRKYRLSNTGYGHALRTLNSLVSKPN